MTHRQRWVRWAAAGAALLVTGTVAACSGPWRDGYFRRGVDRLTQDEVKERLGPPHTAKTPALGGDSTWTYRVPLSDRELEPWKITILSDATQSVGSIMGKPGEAPKVTLYCYRYTLTFNEQKVLKSWKREECVPGTRETLSTQ